MSNILLSFAGTADSPVLQLPVITGFLPTTVSYGSGLLVTGNGFFSATSIKINGLSLNDFVILSDTAVFGTIPWEAESGLIEVINSLGTAISVANCIVDPGNIYEFVRLFAQPEEFLFKL